MKPTTLLRVASVLTLIHAALHTAGGVFGQPTPGPATAAVAAMRDNVFPVFGSMRSYWMFYRGMGLGATISLTFEAIVFWQLGSLAKNDAARLRPLLSVFAVAYFALAINSYLYFFLPPVIVELLIAGCLAGAIAAAKPAAVPAQVAAARG